MPSIKEYQQLVYLFHSLTKLSGQTTDVLRYGTLHTSWGIFGKKQFIISFISVQFIIDFEQKYLPYPFYRFSQKCRGELASQALA